MHTLVHRTYSDRLTQNRQTDTPASTWATALRCSLSVSGLHHQPALAPRRCEGLVRRRNRCCAPGPTIRFCPSGRRVALSCARAQVRPQYRASPFAAAQRGNRRQPLRLHHKPRPNSCAWRLRFWRGLSCTALACRRLRAGRGPGCALTAVAPLLVQSGRRGCAPEQRPPGGPGGAGSGRWRVTRLHVVGSPSTALLGGWGLQAQWAMRWTRFAPLCTAALAAAPRNAKPAKRGGFGCHARGLPRLAGALKPVQASAAPPGAVPWPPEWRSGCAIQGCRWGTACGKAGLR